MKRFFSSSLFISLILCVCTDSQCQTAWYHRWGLLPEKTLDIFINEASGERAFNTVFDLSDPLRKRTSEEYATLLYESKYIAGKLNEYGLQDVAIEKPGKIKAWHPVMGLLQEISPGKTIIADINDNPFVLHPVSSITDTDGELVYVGDASPDIIDPMDLRGKIVLTSSRPDRLLNVFIQKEVAGVVSYYSVNQLEDPLGIDDRKLSNPERQPKLKLFVFNITPRDGLLLRSRLLSGESIILHASVKYRTEDMDLQVLSCIIEGSDPEAGEIILSAHLFEGYGIQGANDNLSGSAVVLETARMLNKLVADGEISRPRRTLRFLWVPEYSGSIPWVNKYPELIKMTLCDINLDMVGLSLSRYRSFFVLHRTSYGNAHYVNDVMENYYRYVTENNQENSVISGDRFFKPIVAPSGSNDPFYIQTESSSGGSDNDVFNDWGIGVPGVLMITWPDPFYHTSEDRADKIDPTQLKRAAFISAAGAYTIANAGENEAIAIAGEVYGNAVRRLGYQISMAGDEINKASADTLKDILKYSMARIRGTAIGEGMTLNSIAELSPSDQFLTKLTASMKKSLSDMADAASASLTDLAVHVASVFGMEPMVITTTREERNAAGIVPVLTENRKGKGYDYLGSKLDNLAPEIKSRYPVAGYVDTGEAALCINGINSVMDIKYLLDAQRNDVTSIRDLLNFFRRMEAAGLIKL
jgi:aminopeptidase YwaD